METEHAITNADRADRARRAVANYTDEHDLTSKIIDFLADLQHYCQLAHGLDSPRRTFDDMLRIARGHFDTEIQAGQVTNIRRTPPILPNELEPIAAALLEALSDCLELWDDLYVKMADDEEAQICNKARAAIAKATNAKRG